MNTQTAKQIEFTRVNSDINGNPRFVCHFLNFLNETDENTAKYLAAKSRNPLNTLSFEYDIAMSKARKIGGKKFSNKQYGGGIVFQSYDNYGLSDQISELKREPVFVAEISEKQAKGLKRAISAHFAWSTLKTNNGTKNYITPNYTQIADFLGLAYTSGSSYAGFWVCNVEAENEHIPGFHYVGFTVGTDGEYYATLWDANENEKIIRL